MKLLEMKNAVCKTKYTPDDRINRGLETEEKIKYYLDSLKKEKT